DGQHHSHAENQGQNLLLWPGAGTGPNGTPFPTIFPRASHEKMEKFSRFLDRKNARKRGRIF
ncbi:MAG: hypothetical protein Q4A80_04760, partial [Bacillota bacterium]|nr:hypothetical protein [Bacillota bacterium]